MLVMIDLDNTLADRARAVAAWAEEFCRHHRLPDGASAWIEELDEDGYADRRSVFETITARLELDVPVDELLAAYRSRIVELTMPTAGAAACLAALRRAGHALVIVTNGSSRQQHAKVEALGLRSAVDAVIVSEDLGVKKPDRRIYEVAAVATGSSLADAWMVGDSAALDIVGAAALGVRTAWLHRGRSWDADMPVPTLVISSLEALPAAIAANDTR